MPTKLIASGGASVSSCVKAKRTTDLTVPQNIKTVIPFDSEEFDTDELHDNTTNNTRITIKKTGVYVVLGQGAYEANTSNQRYLYLYKNGVEYDGAKFMPSSSGSTSTFCSFSMYLEAGDYIELYAYHTSTAANLLLYGATASFSAMLVG